MPAPHHATALITDTTCDIPQSFIDQYGIRVLPLHLIWGMEDLRDQVDILPDAFYRRLAADPVSPTTSQPTIHEFAQVMEEVAAAGAREIVVITVSSQLSGTIESARQAASAMSIPVHVVDSRSAGMGLGWQVLAAARAREGGGSAQAMIDAANRARATMQIMFFVDSLEYLHRGGRIGGAAKLVGTALNLKPLLYVDHAVGRVEPGEKIRTRARALERVYQVFMQQVDPHRPLHVIALHSNAPDLAEALAARIEEAHHPAELLIGTISPVVGVHIGPGAAGLAGYTEA